MMKFEENFKNPNSINAEEIDMNYEHSIRCPKCGGTKISFISNTQSKNRGCLSWIFWFLIIFCTLGVGILFWFFMALTNKKTLTTTRAVCNRCGYQWDI